MSAYAGEPDHFAKLFRAEGGEPRGFAQRRQFARYLGEILEEAAASGLTELVEAKAVLGARSSGGWQISLNDGSSLEADALVLATGNQDPDALSAFAGTGDRFIGNPWGADARAAVEQIAKTEQAVLLVGTGLTMVDVALSLDAAGHRRKIVALSRRGLAPRAHADFNPAPVNSVELPQGLRPLFRWVRRRSAEIGWRAAIDSLRPHSHALWQALSDGEQRRFLRHARPWWDVHRHRVAPEVAAIIAQMVAEERLEIVAARIVAVDNTPDGLRVQFRRRSTNEIETETFGFAFNCTGPLHSITHSRDPLLKSLLSAGQVRPDHLGIGLEVDGNCRAGKHLWAMGPLTKARYWEIIAVPDIREQAAAVAADIQREFGA